MVTSDLLQPQALKPQADALASQGRFGDTQMVHMSMPEIRSIEAQVGQELPINPVTGAKEAFPWVALAAAGAGYLGGKAAEETAAGAQRTQSVNDQRAGQTATAEWLQDLENRGSTFTTGMRPADIGMFQPGVAANYAASAVGQAAQAIGGLMHGNVQKLQDIQRKVQEWYAKEGRQEPPVKTIRGKSGFFGLGGSKDRIDTSERDTWRAAKASIIDPLESAWNALVNVQNDLSFKKAEAERGVFEGIQADYAPYIDNARKVIGSLFDKTMLAEELAVTEPVRQHRLDAVGVGDQARREGLARELNRQAAENQRTRGYGGDSLSTNMQRQGILGAYNTARANALTNAQGMNISDEAGFRLGDLNRALGNVNLPFQQFGLENQFAMAPMRSAAQAEMTRLGPASTQQIGKGTHISGDYNAFQQVPSAKGLGYQMGSNMLSGASELLSGQNAATAAKSAATLGHQRNLELANVMYGAPTQSMPSYSGQGATAGDFSNFGLTNSGYGGSGSLFSGTTFPGGMEYRQGF